MVNYVVILGLVLNMIASILIAYGRIFRSKKIIQKESRTDKERNPEEERQRLEETRIAQIGAGIMVAGFAIQIIGNIFFQ
jgi:predicted histidine transporter YuiF (NhaC family)